MSYGYFKLGTNLSAAGLHAEAVGQFRRAVEIDPASSFNRYFLANALSTIGLNDEAVERTPGGNPDPFPTIPAPSYHPRHPPSGVGQGQNVEALSHHKRALTLEPKNTYIRIRVGAVSAASWGRRKSAAGRLVDGRSTRTPSITRSVTGTPSSVPFSVTKTPTTAPGNPCSRDSGAEPLTRTSRRGLRLGVSAAARHGRGIEPGGDPYRTCRRRRSVELPRGLSPLPIRPRSRTVPSRSVRPRSSPRCARRRIAGTRTRPPALRSCDGSAPER